jgi:hypothetical protein
MAIKLVGKTSVHSITLKYKVVGYYGLGKASYVCRTKKEAEKKFNFFKKSCSGAAIFDMINNVEIKSWKELS